MKHFLALALLSIGIVIAGCSKPIHLGSLNEKGTPNDYLAGLQRSRRDGPADVKTRQALESLSIGVASDTFTVTNTSSFFIDQLGFSCDVARGQSVYFLWDVGSAGDNNNPFKHIFWLVPGTKGRSLTQNNGQVRLLHNDANDDEYLGPNQVSWLLHKYDFSNCRPLDISDATENSPIKTQSQVDKCKEKAKDAVDELACGAAGDATDF